MSRVTHSAAMAGDVNNAAKFHLLRNDGQEDLCFALWRPSHARSRTTALVQKLILPHGGERNVHGNASFEPSYFERALIQAEKEGAGLAFMHSHPLGTGWQGMSPDDIVAENGHAAATFGATGLPLVGLTLAGDGNWSARFWERTAPRTYTRMSCGTVRVLGDGLGITYNDRLAPPPAPTSEQERTVSAWGEESQSALARLRVGVIGVGSVGGLIAESLARTGFEDIMVMDYDRIEHRNLDRLSYAVRSDVERLKVDVLAEWLCECATAGDFRIETVHAAIYEEAGFRAALDCDILFSCVDRPWGRHALNLIAYAHLIPVFDGGIAVRTNRLGKLAAADWRAHTATHGRKCLQCLGQYDPGLIQLEREGMLDDPEYINGLPRSHALRTRENVFGFSMSCASLQMLQMLAFCISPLDQPNPGAQFYHFVGGFMEKPDFETCHANCLLPTLTATGDSSGIIVTGPRPFAHAPEVVHAKQRRMPKWFQWFRLGRQASV